MPAISAPKWAEAVARYFWMASEVLDVRAVLNGYAITVPNKFQSYFR